jgi:thiol-disulfide isomerase/thioredoxin
MTTSEKQYTRQYLKRQNFFQKTTSDFRHFAAVSYILVNLQYPFEAYLDVPADSQFCNKTVAGYMKTDTLRSMQMGDQLRKGYRSIRRSEKSDTIEIRNSDEFGGDIRKRVWTMDGMEAIKNGEEHIKKKINEFAKAYKNMYADDLDNKNQVEEVVVIPEKKLLPDTVPVNTVLKTMEYKPYSMDHEGGKILLLDFWFANCRPCIEAMPKLETLHKTYRDKGFAVIGINPCDYDMDILKGILTKAGVDYDICLDSEEEMVKALGVFSFPTVLLVDVKSKKILASYSGQSDFSGLEKEIENLLKEK